MKRSSLFLSGLILLLICAAGLAQSVRACVAQQLYRHSKYSGRSEPLGRTLNNCYTAHRLYPYNYYYCVYAGRKAFARWESEKSVKHYGVSEYWCGEAYALNPFNSEIQELRTHVLEVKSIKDAVDNWKRYLEWEFWDPYNHAVMAELYARSGDYGSAMLSLEWIRDRKEYEPARIKVLEIWNASRIQPDVK